MRYSQNGYDQSIANIKIIVKEATKMEELILIITMWIVTICTYISYIPQIVKLIKTKKSEDLSIISWLLWTVSSLANLIYSIVLGRTELI